jgi:hypothetical protein
LGSAAAFFVSLIPTTTAPPPATATAPAPAATPASPPWKWILTLVASLAIIAACVWFAQRTPGPAERHTTTAAAVSGADSIRILVGLENGSFTDGFGNVWQSDRYFEGGSVVKLPGKAIFGTRDPRLYQSRRQGAFRYDIPLAPGVYELRLHFAETMFGEDNTSAPFRKPFIFRHQCARREEKWGRCFKTLLWFGPVTRDAKERSNQMLPCRSRNKISVSPRGRPLDAV